MTDSNSDTEKIIRLANELLVDIWKLMKMTFLFIFISTASTFASCYLVWHLFNKPDTSYVDLFLAAGCIVISFMNWEMSMPAIKDFPKLVRERKFIRQSLIEIENERRRNG